MKPSIWLKVSCLICFTFFCLSSCSFFIKAKEEIHTLTSVAIKYNRRDWKHWIDQDHDCQDTRQEVLIRDSLVPVTFKTAKHCKVLKGKWRCPYSGKIFTDPKDLDIDHLVPLKNAHQSGGGFWDKLRKKFYANNLKNPKALLAVWKKLNRQKGSKGPDRWKPPLKVGWCDYAKDWQKVKNNWGLLITLEEGKVLEEMKATCY